MKRDFLETMNQILAIAPELKPHLDPALDQYHWTAPEWQFTLWGWAGRVLEKAAKDHPQEPEIRRIFEGRP